MWRFAYFLVCIIAFSEALPSIYLVEPRSAHIFLQRGEATTNVRLQYQLFNHLASDEPMQFCFDLFSAKLNKNVIEVSCTNLDISTFQLHDLEGGKYMITSYLRYHDNNRDEVIRETRLINHFTVETYADSLPQIAFLTEEKELDFMIVDENSHSADVSLEYTLSYSSLPASHFQVCVFIKAAESEEVVLRQTCLDSSQRVLYLKNVNMGAYTVELTLKDVQSGVLEASSRVSMPLNIKTLVDLLPTIALVDSETEYMLDADTGLADVSLKYRLEGPHTAVSQVVACLRVEELVGVGGAGGAAGAAETSQGEEKRVLLLNTVCVPREHNIFTLSGMRGGRFVGTLTLRNEQNKQLFYSQRDLRVPLELRAAEEFSPTYNWQRLHAWHTIPAGITTRLPLNGVSYKEARIPDPWRLQVSLPSPCRHFLRMDVSRSTTVHDVKKKAAALCKFPPECFIVYANNVVLADPQATAEQADYFSASKRLELDADSCSVLIEKYRRQQENAFQKD